VTRPGEPEPIEHDSRDEISALQLDRLRRLLVHAYTNVPFYRTGFDAAGVHPSDLGELKDLTGVSVTVRLVSPGTLERSSGKAKRVVDLRA